MPGWKTIGSVLALGIPGTALAYLLFFGLIAGAGAAYASLVTYLVPPIALAYGAIFLGERFGATAFGGLALILAGVALGTGGVRFARLRRARFMGETRSPERPPECTRWRSTCRTRLRAPSGRWSRCRDQAIAWANAPTRTASANVSPKPLPHGSR